MAPVIVLLGLALVVVFFILYKRPVKKVTLPENYKDILLHHVSYYQRLGEKSRLRFEEKMKDFLSYVRIDGVDTSVENLDILLVACSAIIPVFGFRNWKYYNLKNVLLYPATFNKENFLASGYEKNTLGMVGTGPLQRIMILSKPALREGFLNSLSTSNTGIHEFVHLLDKEDGEVDGLPETMFAKKNNSKWFSLMNQNIEKIMLQQSDFNPYGAYNQAEFFAVASEYFFNQPVMFKEKHTELFAFLCILFNQDPGVPQ